MRFFERQNKKVLRTILLKLYENSCVINKQGDQATSIYLPTCCSLSTYEKLCLWCNKNIYSIKIRKMVKLTLYRSAALAAGVALSSNHVTAFTNPRIAHPVAT
jgi:hypothetical protein